MGNTTLTEILQEVKETKWFTIMADETRGISNQEQLVVFINKTYTVCEDPTGLVSIPKTEDATILMALKDTLIRCGLPLELCRGQGYDGVSSLKGRLNGAPIQIQRNSRCFTHPLLITLSEPCAAGGWQESDTHQGCTGISAWGCTRYQVVSKTGSIFPWEAVECSYGGVAAVTQRQTTQESDPLSSQVDSAHWCHQCCGAELWDAAGNIWGHAQINTWPKWNNSRWHGITAGGME